MSKSLVGRPKSDVSLMPSRGGQTLVTAGVGSIAILGLAALLPGGIFFWAFVVAMIGIFV